jgi:hypothetical protein
MRGREMGENQAHKIGSLCGTRFGGRVRITQRHRANRDSQRFRTTGKQRVAEGSYAKKAESKPADAEVACKWLRGNGTREWLVRDVSRGRYALRPEAIRRCSKPGTASDPGRF